MSTFANLKPQILAENFNQTARFVGDCACSWENFRGAESLEKPA